MEAEQPWTEDVSVLARWIDRAMSKGGTTTETAAAVGRAVFTALDQHPEKIISGVPNRVPGTQIHWTADVDPARRHITIIDIEPEPRPGL